MQSQLMSPLSKDEIAILVCLSHLQVLNKTHISRVSAYIQVSQEIPNEYCVTVPQSSVGENTFLDVVKKVFYMYTYAWNKSLLLLYFFSMRGNKLKITNHSLWCILVLFFQINSTLYYQIIK